MLTAGARSQDANYGMVKNLYLQRKRLQLYKEHGYDAKELQGVARALELAEDEINLLRHRLQS